MAATEEDWHVLPDGHRLYTKTWKTQEPARARIVFVHGFSDHCSNNYEPLFNFLTARGIEVFGFDQRGWGKSVKEKREQGLTGPTSLVLSDISSILTRFIPPNATGPLSPPLFLMGHSMGGQVVTHYAALHHSPVISGYLLDAPYVGLTSSMKPMPIVVFGGRLLARIAPHSQMKQMLHADLLSRDPATIQSAINDDLCHDIGTLEGLAGMLDRMAALESGKINLKGDQKIWVSHGTKDGICDFEATKKWVEGSCKVKDQTFKAYEGWYHMLHAEPGEDKKIYATDVADWILARV